MGHLTLQGTPNKWGLPRWCLVRPKTCQGRVPQSHECSPHKWGLLMTTPCQSHECSLSKRGLLMTQGSLDCNRCIHIYERDPNKWGFLRSSLGGCKTSQGCGPHVCRSPQPRAELDVYFGRFSFGRLFWTFIFGCVILDILTPEHSSTSDPDAF